ncbi:MAG: high-potential iron-sulfur protein [Salinibacter sp.]
MDSDSELLPRRGFLRSLGLAGMASLSGSLLLACGGSGDSSGSSGSSEGAAASASCSDLSGLSEQEKKRRTQMVKSLQYTETSPKEKRRYSNCQLYRQKEYGAGCGGCQLFPGPVAAEGYCNSWTPAS